MVEPSLNVSMTCPHHDVMSQTLSQLPASTVSSESYSPEKHLCPAKDRIALANETVEPHSPGPQRFLVYVQFQVDSEYNLSCDRYEHY